MGLTAHWSPIFRKFSTEFVYVTVTGDSVTTCDNPAAPAWAAHILKANDKPKKAAERATYVSQVAKEMTTGATFIGVAKSEQEDYAKKVLAYLNPKLGGGLVLPSDWPPSDCTVVTE